MQSLTPESVATDTIVLFWVDLMPFDSTMSAEWNGKSLTLIQTLNFTSARSKT